MKSYKSTPKLKPNLNYIKYQQSDIFIQKGLNKPEITYSHKKQISKNTFQSTYNFLEWKEMSPHADPSITIKPNPNNTSQILNSNTAKYIKKINKKHNTFYEKMHENEPEKVVDSKILNKNINNRYQKETINLGDYDGEEYKIKKNKSTIYQLPISYLEPKNPLNKKMDIIYGGTENIIGNYKPIIHRNNNLLRSSSSIGYIKKDFETNNDYDRKIINDPKKMKYFLLYGESGIDTVNNKNKLKTITVSRSTNNIYTPGINPKQNRINFLRSNIFNNTETEQKNKDTMNSNYRTIKVNRHLKNKTMGKRSKSSNKIINNFYTDNNDINVKNHSKKFLYNKNGDNLPVKLDWRDPKINLLFPQNKSREILQKNSRQRKFNDLYGTEPVIPKEKLGEEFKTNARNEVEKITKENYENINYAKLRKISDNISQYQIGNLNLKNYDINNYTGTEYELYTKKCMINDIEKKFAERGVHIYDIKENMDSVMNNKSMNKIEFKIRENKGDQKLKNKINEIKNELKKNNVLMHEKVNNIKENNDIIAKTLNWNTPHCDLLIKNKKLENSKDGKVIYTKGKIKPNNEEEKVTRIFVNLKYKNNRTFK